MYKILRPLKDTYITNHVVDEEARVHANVGGAGSLNLYKLYGRTDNASVELSRLLIQFDLEPLRELWQAGKVSILSDAFSCKLYLHDVYDGQPTPADFTVNVYPLSKSFDEGQGRDVVLLSDMQPANWLTASIAGGIWFVSGAGQAGASGPCDYLTGTSYFSSDLSLKASQHFLTGEEDLNVDVTDAVVSALVGAVPDVGFRISFDPSLEGDNRTYFVKRFASRTAYNDDLRPKLIVRYDDSIQDDTNDLYLDAPSTLFLRNYVRNAPANLISGSTQVIGNNCLRLQLVTPVSGGTYTLQFTGSQHFINVIGQTGLYSASVTIPSNTPSLIEQWQYSGSVTFTPVWKSVDGTVTYLTGDPVIFSTPNRGPEAMEPKQYVVSILGLPHEVSSDQFIPLRINVFDHTRPYLTQYVKLPVELPGIVLRDVHYQVRDALTSRIVVPFDLNGNSTRASNDSKGMYFDLDCSNLTQGHSYVIDVMIVVGTHQQLYKAVSPTFRVVATT